MHQPAARPATSAQPATPAQSATWSRTYPGRPNQARQARRFLASVLDGCTAAEDAVLCLSELAANALTHSNSCRKGGQFTIRAHLRNGCVRVEVHDDGGPWTQPASSDGQCGRGLFIVSQLARDWGRTGDSETGWTVWFEMDCP